jgi:uncharacterized membrane protein YjfL (UPF0719 family)
MTPVDFLTDFEWYVRVVAKPAAQLFVIIACVLALWLIINRITKLEDRDGAGKRRDMDDHILLFQQQNRAYLIQRLSIVVAQIIAMTGAIAATPTQAVADVVWLAVEGIWILLFLLAARVLVDKVVLLRVDNLKAMREGNTAIGIVEAGFYIGFGLILNGSLSGSAPTIEQGFLSSLVFSVLGVALVIGVYWLHEYVTPYHVRSALEEGRVATALELAGVLIAVSLVVRQGVAGDFTGWGVGLTGFFSVAVLAIALLYLMRFVLNKLLPGTCKLVEIHENNLVGAAGFMAGLFVAEAFAVSVLMSTALASSS